MAKRQPGVDEIMTAEFCDLCGIEHNFVQKHQTHEPTSDNDYTSGSFWYEPFDEWVAHNRRRSAIGSLYTEVKGVSCFQGNEAINWAKEMGLLTLLQKEWK